MRTDNSISIDNSLAVSTPTLMKMLNCGKPTAIRYRSRSKNHCRAENLVESKDYTAVS